jgi:ketosteroid isomerase-like protein
MAILGVHYPPRGCSHQLSQQFLARRYWLEIAFLATGGDQMTTYEKAATPNDITRLFVEFANAKDAAGLASLYEVDAVMAYPPGCVTEGRAAILELWTNALPHMPNMEIEDSFTTLISEGIALTGTPAKDGAGVRVQVARRQSDGSWLRLLDNPELA